MQSTVKFRAIICVRLIDRIVYCSVGTCDRSLNACLKSLSFYSVMPKFDPFTIRNILDQEFTLEKVHYTFDFAQSVGLPHHGKTDGSPLLLATQGGLHLWGHDWGPICSIELYGWLGPDNWCRWTLCSWPQCCDFYAALSQAVRLDYVDLTIHGDLVAVTIFYF